MRFKRDSRELVETALGNSPADTVIRDGVLMDVYTGRLLPHRSVAIKDQWIAYVGPDAGHIKRTYHRRYSLHSHD
ncbi:MAG: hypothetical protein JRJ86_13770 [Deltaproteobacteria bacterium]|nr:hypothetical protein [Deltaproteobacteria bacterium]MBW2358590.1 hypothetical protein [Deltaproteobacteria bacterium]